MSHHQLNGLILTGRVGKYTDELAAELVHSTQAQTNCKEWHTDGWGGNERVFDDEVKHYISKALTQRLERTNGIVRQQTGRWHRRVNKFSFVMATNQSYPTLAYQLLQLDLGAFSRTGLQQLKGQT